MNRAAWKWLLPILQLAFASACFVYGPHEYRVGAQRDGAVNNIEYTFQHLPAPAERISQGINFPALALAYPLREYDNAIYSHNSAYTLIWISPREIGFFIGIAVFWYWLGRELGQSHEQAPGTTWPRKLKIIMRTCGLVFAILTGAYALQMTASHWHPDRQIGAFGIIWSFALTAYFGWRLTREIARE